MIALLVKQNRGTVIRPPSSHPSKMHVNSTVLAEPKPTHRSAVSNGSALLPNVDGRSTWARRLRDVMELHLDDLGGEAMVSEAERSIVRRIATLTVEMERLEAEFANAGGAKAADLDLYQRTSGNLRRLLEAIGMKRRPRNVTPDLRDYVSARA